MPSANTPRYQAQGSAEVSWVSPPRLWPRLDASFYAPKYIKLDLALERFNKSQIEPLRKFLKAPRRILYMGTQTYERHQAPPDAVPFISGVDLDGTSCSLKWTTPLYVDGWMAERYPKGLLFPGALLVKVKGPNQSAAYVESVRTKSLVSGSIFFSGTCGIDPFYLVAFLCSSYGTYWRTRLRTNLTVEFVSNDDLKEMPIVRASETVQRAVGNMLRKSNRLRELAEKVKAEAASRLNDFLRWPISLSSGPTSFVSNNDASTSRLDAKFYLPAFLELRNHLRRLPGGCQNLGNILKNVYNGTEFREFTEDGRPYLCVKDIDSGRLDVASAPRIPLDAAIPKKALIEAGDVLIVRTGSLGQAALVRSVDENNGTAISSHFIRLVLKDKDDAAIVTSFLNSDAGQLLQQQITYGAVQPQISQDDLASIPVPLWNDELKQYLTDAENKWREYLDESDHLGVKARASIESIITGSSDEAQLLSESSQLQEWLSAHPGPRPLS